jgi:ABC-2 type transport system permease protein
MIQPVLYLLLYMPLLKNLGNASSLPLGQIAQIFVPGMLVIMGLSCLFAGFSFIPEIRNGFITRLLVTPASRVAIIVSLIINTIGEVDVIKAGGASSYEFELGELLEEFSV